MKPRIWVVFGATSIIAEKFAQLAASEGHSLRLVARDAEQLNIVARDIELRYPVSCEAIPWINTSQPDELLSILHSDEKESDVFIAQSDFTGNALLTTSSITQLIEVNILTSVLIITHYLKIPQTQHHLLYLGSVASLRGRARNSLYGGSKAAVEIYLQGLQQSATPTQRITIARLGFIDTRQTYGMPGIFYAADPSDCAKACWKAVKKGKRTFYYPWFWRGIMGIITRLPFFIYKRLV